MGRLLHRADVGDLVTLEADRTGRLGGGRGRYQEDTESQGGAHGRSFRGPGLGVKVCWPRMPVEPA